MEHHYSSNHCKAKLPRKQKKSFVKIWGRERYRALFGKHKLKNISISITVNDKAFVDGLAEAHNLLAEAFGISGAQIEKLVGEIQKSWSNLDIIDISKTIS